MNTIWISRQFCYLISMIIILTGSLQAGSPKYQNNTGLLFIDFVDFINDISSQFHDTDTLHVIFFEGNGENARIIAIVPDTSKIERTYSYLFIKDNDGWKLDSVELMRVKNFSGTSFKEIMNFIPVAEETIPEKGKILKALFKDRKIQIFTVDSPPNPIFGDGYLYRYYQINNVWEFENRLTWGT